MKTSKEYQKEYYEKHKAEKKAKSALNRRRIIDWYKDYKSQLICRVCGESHPACLDFHHKDENKECGISRMVYKGCSIDNIKTEINKCTVLCANCHRKEHYKRD